MHVIEFFVSSDLRNQRYYVYFLVDMMEKELLKQYKLANHIFIRFVQLRVVYINLPNSNACTVIWAIKSVGITKAIQFHVI